MKVRIRVVLIFGLVDVSGAVSRSREREREERNDFDGPSHFASRLFATDFAGIAKNKPAGRAFANKIT